MDMPDLTLYIWVLVVSVWGGSVTYLRWLRTQHEHCQQFAIVLIADISTGAFSGTIAFLFCSYYRLDNMATLGIVGIASHAGNKVLVVGEKHLFKKMNLQVDEYSRPRAPMKPLHKPRSEP